MNELAFAGYWPLPAGADDPLRVKWNAMRANLDVSTILPPQPTLEGVSAFNLHINRIITFNPLETEDLSAWQSPKQTLMQAQGDCKDYTLLKYAALLKSGVPVRVVIGEIKTVMKNNPQHAWCAAYLGGAWRALDNNFDQIIRVEDYTNWLPVAAMHDASVVKFGAQFSINEIINKAKVI
jgi:predicted transglutaminase-like cysteine proteinase